MRKFNRETNFKPRSWKLFSLIALSLGVLITQAWAAGEGTSGAPFLKIGTSSRAEAMGGAHIAVTDDVDAIYWNPAGLMQLKRSTIGLTHLEWFENIRYEYISYADKYDYVGAIGASVGFLYLGNIPKTIETAAGDYDESKSGGTFGASDLLMNFAWAGNLGLRENKVGVGVKIIQESIDINQSYSFALDFGDQFLISKTRWFRKFAKENLYANIIPATVGISIKNLGTPVKFFNQNDPLPLTAGLGMAYEFLDNDLNAGLDFNYHTVEQLFAVYAGAEYWIHTGIDAGNEQTLDVALRAGFRSGYDASTAPGFSFGAGMRYSALGLDYVFMPFGDLGVTHRVSLKFSWGEALKDKIASRRKHLVKGQLSASELAMNDRAEQMVKSKKFMEEKVVVQKATDAKFAMTAVEAKKPEDQQAAQETKQVETKSVEQQSVTIAPGAVIKGNPKKIDNELISQITRTQDNKGQDRTRSKYIRRSQEDAIRAARQEAELKSQAFDEVESAAQEEAKSSNEEGGLITKTMVYFAQDSGKLDQRYYYALDKISITFDKFPQRTILVHGYAAGDETDKQSLSVNRAKAVKDYFVQIKSIPAGKISIKGFADSEPIADNNNKKQKARNRRVMINLIKSGN